MRIPRQVSGLEVAKARRAPGYERARPEGSHLRLTTAINGTHHVTNPHHKPLIIGPLLGGILMPVAAHHGLTVEELPAKLGW